MENVPVYVTVVENVGMMVGCIKANEGKYKAAY